MKFFQDDRRKSIESLEFFIFLADLYFSLLKKNDTENRFIQEFIEVIKSHYVWQAYKIGDYSTSLRDHVFWQSREFYLKSMQKFVSHELTGAEFVNQFFFKILNDRKEYSILEEDFKSQATLELNPKSYQFSEIIDNFYLALEAFDDEPEPEDSAFLTEDQLRQIVKNVLPRVEKYFIEEI
jgi:hypothetical protein